MRLRSESLENYIMMARDRLIKVAEKRQTITYSELMREMGGPGRGYIKQVLSKICQGEDRQARPLLGALVVRKNEQLPGNGFWKSPAIPKPISNGSKQQQIDFWEKECRKVYEYWRDNSP